MAGGFKRGGFRGGGGGAFKKGYAKKRSPEDDDDAPRSSKRSKGDDEEEDEEDTAPFVPKLQTDDDSNPFVAVCLPSLALNRVIDKPSSTIAANDVSQ